MLEFLEFILSIEIVGVIIYTLLAIFFALLPLLSFIKLCQIKRALYDIADMTAMQLSDNQSGKKPPNSRNGEVDEDQPINLH